MSIQTAGQEGEKDAAKAPELVMVKWKDDNNLIVTGSLKNFDDSTKPVSYLYTLPLGSNSRRFPHGPQQNCGRENRRNSVFCLSCGETPWQSEAGRMAVPFDGINLKESILHPPGRITPAQGDAGV